MQRIAAQTTTPPVVETAWSAHSSLQSCR